MSDSWTIDRIVVIPTGEQTWLIMMKRLCGNFLECRFYNVNVGDTEIHWKFGFSKDSMSKIELWHHLIISVIFSVNVFHFSINKSQIDSK